MAMVGVGSGFSVLQVLCNAIEQYTGPSSAIVWYRTIGATGIVRTRHSTGTVRGSATVWLGSFVTSHITVL